MSHGAPPQRQPLYKNLPPGTKASVAFLVHVYILLPKKWLERSCGNNHVIVTPFSKINVVLKLLNSLCFFLATNQTNHHVSAKKVENIEMNMRLTLTTRFF